MKENMKFFTIVISLLLLSAMILTGCMSTIAADCGEMKPYDLDGQKEVNDGSGGSITEGDAPTAQLPLQRKFNEYLHSDENTVIVFSAEQYAQLKAVRENGERIPLSYEEILFLVSDSISMYFTYDVISLYNANVDGVLPVTLTFSTMQSSSSCIISPYHGDFSEFENYEDALDRYERMLQEIYAIIYYRIYMHDAGFESVFHHYHSGKDLVFGRRYETSPISSAVPVGSYQMLAIDHASFSGIDNEEKLCVEYKTLLEWKRIYEADTIMDYEHYPYLNSAVLYTSILNTVRQPLEYKFYIAGPKNDPARQIYPTPELESMMPHKEFVYEAVASNDSIRPVFSLNYENGRVAMSQSVYHSFALIGVFDEHDGVLKMHFGTASSEHEDQYSYVFYKHGQSYVYSAENSGPTFVGFDFADGLIFEPYHEGAASKPDPDFKPPANDEKDPDIVEEQWGYLKYDANCNYCSLMSSEGFTVIEEGSYVKEDDKLVFMFKTADGIYTYYFHYRGDNLYTYAKGQSNPAPEYGFEDEMEFVLTVFDGGSCFLEPKKE